ncbi:uncharacterized protein LOC115890389 isoform X6 [Sitophilus oryzae]|uniref:Uncharacterized protein LOC115890389 isoform X6 n=1 Tax=Sitophilus oryzae TaxID=7048 RepID=A0A6J2YT67_SITOR|nr:uncharacterized protein LOC115890389 isoform X6 [Sitophilus oryzae]
MFADHDPKEIYKLHSYVNDTDDSSTNSDESDALLQFKPALYTYEELSDAIIIEPEGCYICIAKLVSPHIATSHYNSKKHKRNIAAHCVLNNLKSKQDIEAIVKEKIENLTLPDYCYICKANLMLPDNATSHYNSKRHKNNITVHRDGILNNLKSEQQESIIREKIENLTLPDFCHICKANLTTSENATSHYNSKKHKSNIAVRRDEILNNLKIEQQEAIVKEKIENLILPDFCHICKANLMTSDNATSHYNSNRHKSNIVAHRDKILNNLKVEQQEAIVKEKIENLTLPDYCYICKANLMAPGNATSHYNSTKHKSKIQAHRDEILNNLKSEQQDLKATKKEKREDLTPPDYCDICKVKFISPQHTRTHYNSKRHKHNIELENNLNSLQKEAVEDKSYCCFVCGIELNSKELYDNHVQNSGHKSYSSVLQNKNSHETIVNVNSNDCNISTNKASSDSIAIGPVGNVEVNGAESALKHGINSSKNIDKSKYIQDKQEKVMSKSEQNLEATVKEKIEDLTPPDYCYICKVNLMSPFDATSHYNSKRHKRKIVVHRDEIINNLKSEKQKAVDVKSYCCLICDIRLNSKKLYNSHLQSNVHQLYASIEKTNFGHKPIINMNSNDCNITEGENETAACYNANEKEPVIDDLEAQEIKPVINNEEMLKINDTNQKEPVIDILELNNLKSEQQDLEAILKEKLEDLTLPNYCYICKANLMTPGSATSHYNSKRHKRNIVVCRDEIVKNLKSEQQEAVEVKRKEELNPDINNGEMLEKNNINQKEPVIEILDETGIQPGIDNGEKLKKNNTNQKEPGIDILELNNLKSEQQDLKATKKEKREDLTPPDYCDICKVKFISPQHTKTHYNSKRHKHNIELENNLNSLQQEAVEDKSYCCFVCGIELNSKQLYDNHVQNSGHKSYSSVLQNKNSHETIVNVNSNDCNISTNKASSDSIAIGPVGNVEVNGAELALKHRINSSNNIDKSKYIQDKQEKVMSESEQDLEATVKEIIEDLTPPYYCYICKVNLMSPFDATSHYNSKKHKRKIVVHRDEIINNLKSEKQKAVDVKSYCCLICDIRLNSKKLYNSHLQSNVHQLYASIEKTNFGHKPIINMNSNDCNITEGENETTACYNANEKEPVIDDLETQEIKPIINNEEMLKINDTNQKEPVIDILELNNLKSEQQDLEAIVKEKNRGFDTTRLLLYMQK